MSKQLLKGGAALLLTIASGAAMAQDGAGAAREPKALGCAAPVMPREAARYELQGDTGVLFDLDDEGRPVNARVGRSSGWKLLDAAAIRGVSTCRYAPPTDPAFKRTGIRTLFSWRISPPRNDQVPAAFVAGSCPASERFADFRPLAGTVTQGEGLLLRFVLDAAGKPSGVRTEGNSSAEVYQAAVAYLEACRFTPASENGKPAHGNLYGRLVPKDV